MKTAPFCLSVPLKSPGPSIGRAIRGSYGENWAIMTLSVRFLGLIESGRKCHVIAFNRDRK